MSSGQIAEAGIKAGIPHKRQVIHNSLNLDHRTSNPRVQQECGYGTCPDVAGCSGHPKAWRLTARGAINIYALGSPEIGGITCFCMTRPTSVLQLLQADSRLTS